MKNLDQYGGACRCLLRLRENAGQAFLSDEAFIARFQERFPDWADRPGDVDAGRLLVIAEALGLATRLELFRGYAHVLAQHRAGNPILVLTERAPQQGRGQADLRRYTLLVVGMDEAGFILWCPYPSGQAETFPKMAPEVWEEWQSIGLVLQSHAVTDPSVDLDPSRRQTEAA